VTGLPWLSLVGGSGHFLLYESHLAGAKNCRLYLANKAGKSTRLLSFANATQSTWTWVSMSGATVLVTTTDRGQNTAYYWRLPSTRRHVLLPPAGYFPESAAPGGYIAFSGGHGSQPVASYVTFDGTITRLGRLFAKDYAEDEGYIVLAGPDKRFVAFVAFGDAPGGIRTGRLEHPGHYRWLAKPGTDGSSCGQPGRTYVGCSTSSRPDFQLFDYKTGKRVAGTNHGCGSTPATRGAALFLVGNPQCAHPGRLYEYTHGKLTHSTRRFDPYSPVRALGTIAVVSRSTHQILTVESATRAPHVLLASR